MPKSNGALHCDVHRHAFRARYHVAGAAIWGRPILGGPVSATCASDEAWVRKSAHCRGAEMRDAGILRAARQPPVKMRCRKTRFAAGTAALARQPCGWERAVWELGSLSFCQAAPTSTTAPARVFGDGVDPDQTSAQASIAARR